MDNLYFKVAMAKFTSGQKATGVIAHAARFAEPLNRRRSVTVDLPEFLVRAIHARVDEANQNDPDGEDVSFNDVVEWLLVSEITIRRMPVLEASIPGFTAATATWLMTASYQDTGEE